MEHVAAEVARLSGNMLPARFLVGTHPRRLRSKLLRVIEVLQTLDPLKLAGDVCRVRDQQQRTIVLAAGLTD